MNNTSNNGKMQENESTLGLTSKMISLEQIQMPFSPVCFKF